jgi:glycosyltransferase involved in cell wall biosynthesis
MLVRSFLAVQAEVNDVQLALVGHLDPVVERQLMEMVPTEQRGQVLVVDNADRRRFHALLARGFVTCMPSLSESSNRVLVESLALGTAVICADGAAASEVIDEDAVDLGAGLRFALGDEAACSAGIMKLIERAGTDQVLAGCRSRASLYDWSFIGPNLVDLYRQAAVEN